MVKRTYGVTRSQVLEQLQQGKSVKDIASILNTTTGNIRAHRKRIIDLNLWKPTDKQVVTAPTKEWDFDLDQATDFLIERLEKAKLVIELQEKVWLLENQKAALENEIKVMKQNIVDKADRLRRYNIALELGHINAPLTQ